MACDSERFDGVLVIKTLVSGLISAFIGDYSVLSVALGRDS